ncbi:stage V sporulation protein T [Pelotomaculum terephthalicicum JT]|uniref:stage V sporulation T C-terminal domain-containing protein n=1 Tax=Pelotomaculum TaxID=191373 RepID=UPI001F0375C1|nr:MULTISPECIES: stage V sporulation T C-terminal domain-containing protein [Pelotomaculum]MCG9967591.1 stage V sporulation protein T [Pelotomaculum terephthalicicum JT]
MRATGFVRRIDELGRFLIPKEIRNSLRIKHYSSLEILTDYEGEVIFKKFSPIKELGLLVEEYAQSLYNSLGHTVCIADKENIITVAGSNKKRLLNRQLNPEIERIMEERRIKLCATPLSLTADDVAISTSIIIAPIIVDCDVIGAVILMSKNPDAKMGRLELKMAETAAGFLGKQIAI